MVWNLILVRVALCFYKHRIRELCTGQPCRFLLICFVVPFQLSALEFEPLQERFTRLLCRLVMERSYWLNAWARGDLCDPRITARAVFGRIYTTYRFGRHLIPVAISDVPDLEQFWS
mmetsp:Transcript_28083/g.43851  ORF Transcript_28083/g.43851 Transcript_28083/m.43851 type:complete len:117 (-) Transcript_28083:496-846(-)